MNSAELKAYGIAEEESDIRAHVGIQTKTVYAFPTIEGVRVIQNASMTGWRIRPATQPGVDFATALGYVGPWNSIQRIRRIRYPLLWVMDYCDKLSTSDKGMIAVRIIQKLLRIGRFPLWTESEVCRDKDIDISGTDITVKGKWRIQVKCDARCGEKELGGTGNIYLQTHECNPFKRR